MSEPLAVFQSAYASRTLKAYDAYEGTFLDVFITNEHPATVSAQPNCNVETEDGQIVAQLHFRMNTTDEQVMRDLLNKREEDRQQRIQFLQDWDVALEMNERFDFFKNRTERLSEIAERTMTRYYQTLEVFDKIKLGVWDQWGF